MELLAAALASLAACGGSGAAPAGSTGGAVARDLRLRVLDHDPAADAVQVALDASPMVEFDGAIAVDCLADEATGLFRVRDGERLGCTTTIDHGRRVAFHPLQALDAESDYELRLSALTSDIDGRLLDEDFVIRFRTLDSTPPQILGLSPQSAAHPIRHGEPVVVLADERLDPASVGSSTVDLRDRLGRSVGAGVSCENDRIVVEPIVDLQSDVDWSIAIHGIRDRSGNRVVAAAVVRFRSAVDITGPDLLSAWPDSNAVISPLARIELKFDESIALPSVDASPTLRVASGKVVPIEITMSPDQRTLLITPREKLAVGVAYQVRSEFDAGLLDVSGNPYPQPVVLAFVVGDDATPPAVESVAPTHSADRIDPRTGITIRFDEEIDASRLDPRGITLSTGATPLRVAALDLDPDRRTVRCWPAEPLPTLTVVDVRLVAASQAFRDLAGNMLAQDRSWQFETSADPLPLTVLIWPESETVGLPFDATLALLADGTLDPTTVDTDRFEVLDAEDTLVAGSVQTERADRVVRFTPAGPWTPGASYSLHVRGGPEGLRKLSGNWMDTDVVQHFRVGFRSDADPPELEVTINAVHAPRNVDRSIDRQASTIDFRARAGTDPALDLTSAELTIEGSGTIPSSEVLFAHAEFTTRSLSVRLQGETALAPGHYVLRGRVRDLSGGFGAAPPLEFDVVDAGPAEKPFDRTQVVWVRFDLDRDGNGVSDFDDDLLRIGLLAAGDPLGTNARMSRILRDGVLAETHRIFGRRRDGAPLGVDSVPLRLTARAPIGIPAMQIACGGFDPQGERGRRFGATTTGILGRARYDYRNALISDLAISSAPGLGVFPAELFLFESRVHLDVYPGFVTAFAQRFMPLSPDLGGTPAGMDARDVRALAEDFDPDTATATQRARYSTIFAAADDWAACVGTILAHEIGHTVGLVAPGRTSYGLHGDASLHNEFSSPGDVMSAAIGFDAMVALPFAFRDLNLAYLRQRVILR